MGDAPPDGMEPPPLPDGATSAPDLQFQLNLRDRGTYIMWIQFRGGNMFYAVPFRLTAR
jgi:hypothetical protein